MVINVLFLAVIVIDAVEDISAGREAIDSACAVLRRGGIMLDPDDVRTGGAMRAMRTTRGDEAEANIARAVLGPTEMSYQGVIYLYENAARGRAEFRSACDFEIALYEGVITNADGSLKIARRLLRRMKIETSELTLSGNQGNQGLEVVTAYSAYKGASIFNCAIEFVFRDGSLETIVGRYATDIESLEDGAEMNSAGTALLGFLAWVRRENIECARISSVEAGYQHRVVGSFGEGVIAPVWLIEADSGRYLIDDETGEIWAQ